MLKREGIPHTVLNAKFHELEAEIVAGAGQHGAVTIATNMAGNGPEYKTKQLPIADLYPADGYNTGLFYNECRTDCTGDEIK